MIIVFIVVVLAVIFGAIGVFTSLGRIVRAEKEESAVAKAAAEPTTPKRGRGRPRKQPTT